MAPPPPWSLSLQFLAIPPTTFTFAQALVTVSLLVAIAAASWILLSQLQQRRRQQATDIDDERELQKKLQLPLPLPPGRMGLPLVGETLDFLRAQKQNRAWAFAADRVEEYAGAETFKTSLFGDPTVVVTSPAGNKMAFGNTNISWPSSVVEVIGSQSLLAHTGERAQRIRNSFQAFLINPESLRRYTHRVSQVVISVFHEQIDRSSSSPPEILAYPFMKRLMFSIICTVLVGIHHPASQDSLFSHFCTLLHGILQIPVNLPGTRYRAASSASRAIKRILQRLIDEKRSNSKLAAAGEDARDEQEEELDMLSGLMAFKDENGNRMSDEEIKDNLVLLLFAGNDTSSIAATMTIRFLALHPSIMDDVYKENMEVAQGIVASRGSHDHHLKWEDLYKLKLTWRVVQETLRLQPPAQGSFKVATEDFSFDGYRIPKSWKIFWSTNSTARNPKYFPEPEKFDPSRFEGAGPAPFTYAPFGGGPRMCPGYEFARMELLIILHHLVTRFSWTLKYPDEDITLDSFPRPVKGLPILLRPRTH